MNPSRKLLRASAAAALLLLIGFSSIHNYKIHFLHDDAYYYFKIASNITQGFGITFDTINPTNGFHPLWMLVLLPLFALITSQWESET